MVLLVGEKLWVQLLLLNDLNELVYKGCILLVDVDIIITAFHYYYYPANHSLISTINKSS